MWRVWCVWRVLPDRQAQVQAGAADGPTRTLLPSSAVTSETRDRERVMTQRDFPFVFFTFPHIFSLLSLTQQARLAKGSLQMRAVFQQPKLTCQLVETQTLPPDVVCSALIKNRLLNLKMCLKMQKKKSDDVNYSTRTD